MAVHSGVASVPPAADSLLCLPNEILLIIKTLIPPWDIRTHVCYFYTCQRIAGLYGNADKQEDFWASACHLAGIGMLPGEHKQTVSWTDIALECIEDDGFCGHPRCGGALLEHNAAEMAAAAELCPEWNPEMREVLSIWSETDNPWPKPHDIFHYLAFATENHHPFKDINPYEDAYLRLGDNKIPRRTLTTHAIARRSFATIPPVAKMTLLPGSAAWPVIRPNGVTVWDVQSIVHRNLDKQIQDSELRALLSIGFNNFVGHDAEDLSDTLVNFDTIRGLFALCNWNGLELKGTGVLGPYYSVSYTPLKDEAKVAGA